MKNTFKIMRLLVRLAAKLRTAAAAVAVAATAINIQHLITTRTEENTRLEAAAMAVAITQIGEILEGKF